MAEMLDMPVSVITLMMRGGVGFLVQKELVLTSRI